MWALRRATNPIKYGGFRICTSQLCRANSETASYCLGETASFVCCPLETHDVTLSSQRFYHATPHFFNLYAGGHDFSLQAGTKSSGEEDDDLEDGFSELETPISGDSIQKSPVENENDDELVSEPELSEEEEDDDEGDDLGKPEYELELSETEAEVSEKKSQSKKVSSTLFKAILEAPGLSVNTALNKWVEGGNKVTQSEVSLAMLNLRRRRMFGRALQLSEWLESTKQLELVERDYASRLDLIAKVRGIQKAEYYIESIPISYRGEVIYRTLLANCVATGNVRKAEQIFNRMKDLKFPITSFACNQLLLLYKRMDKKKIADVLLLMEKDDVKPTLFTYKLLIDTKGQSNDINGMDQLVETMKAEGIEPDINTRAILARHYSCSGLREKAEAVLKEMEGDNLKESRWAAKWLLPLYAALGNAEDVGRVWKACEANPRLAECMAAIEAWGKLKKIDEAEAAFDRISKISGKLSSKHYSVMLKVYANHKMLSKGKELVKRMGEDSCRIGPLTWDALVRLYVESGEVEKADSILQKATQQTQMKPLFSSYMIIMDQYAKRGDIHNAEKMFHRMRQAGYTSRFRQFQSLIQAYINAKAPAYGIRERMKADNIFPNRALAAQLPLVDAFRKTTVSDLLD